MRTAKDLVDKVLTDWDQANGARPVPMTYTQLQTLRKALVELVIDARHECIPENENAKMHALEMMDNLTLSPAGRTQFMQGYNAAYLFIIETADEIRGQA